ncbi:MAG: glycoside hydrolase family 30 beta sandwich domain-containing protein, partial [Planctomycetota bacterium]
VYLKKFIDAYTAAGLPIDALSLQNEPLFNPGNYPSMLMSASQQLDLIKNHVGPVFEVSDIDTKLLLYDHNWDNIAYADQILDDPVARDFVAGTAFHGYAGNVSAQGELHQSHPDKGIYFTEITGGDFAPNFDDNLVFGVSNIIIGNLRNWGRTALYWNLALDENNGPHLNGCNDCRGVVTINSQNGAVEFNEEYYTLAHASKFLERGAERIDSFSANGIVETVAFQNPSGSRVLIALNPSTTVKSFRIVENDQHVFYQLPEKSVVTFVWGAVPADFDDNGSLSIEDLDRLVAAIATGDHPDLFDLNADGLVNLADRDQWLVVAGETNLASGNPYLVGDANLDGTVDGQDFLAWNNHKFGPTGAWSEGDFNADGVTDGQDFILWNNTKFTSAEIVSVPEPRLSLWWVCLWLVPAWRCL